MRNFAKLLGIIAMVAVIGFSFTACKEDDAKDALDGTTWETAFSGMNEDYELIQYYLTLKFNSPNFTITITGEFLMGTGNVPTQTQSGTYSISDSTVTMIFADGSTKTGTIDEDFLTLVDFFGDDRILTKGR